MHLKIWCFLSYQIIKGNAASWLLGIELILCVSRDFSNENSRSGGGSYKCSQNAAARNAAFYEKSFIARAPLAIRGRLDKLAFGVHIDSCVSRDFSSENSRSGGGSYKCSQNAAATHASFCGDSFIARATLAIKWDSVSWLLDFTLIRAFSKTFLAKILARGTCRCS